MKLPEGLRKDEQGNTWALVDCLAVEEGLNVRRNTKPSPGLLASVKEHGVLNPINIRLKNGSLYLVDGERRYNAVLKLEQEEVPVFYNGPMDDMAALVMSVVANENQKPLSKQEQAAAFIRLRRDANKEDGEIAELMGCSDRRVKEVFKILEQGSAKVKKAATNGEAPTRALARATSLPKKVQDTALKEMEGKNQEESLKVVRKHEKRLKIAPAAGRKPNEYHVVSDFRERCEQMEEECRKRMKDDPDDKRLRTILDVIHVFKGIKAVKSLFPRE